MRHNGISPDGFSGEGRPLIPFTAFFLVIIAEKWAVMVTVLVLPWAYRNLESSLNPAEGSIIVY